MKISGREATLGWVTIVALVLGGTWWFGQPKLQEWKEFATTRATLERRARSAQKLLDEQSDVEQRLAALRQKLPVYPAGRNMAAELLRILDNTARDNIDLLRRDTQAETSAGELFEVAITCTWAGDLEALVRFLYALQEQNVILTIRQLAVNPSPGQPGRLGGTFTLDCAYSRETADTPKAEATAP